MDSIEIKCPFAKFEDFSLLSLDIIGKEEVRPLTREEIIFLINNCLECKKKKKIKITKEGDLLNCPTIKNYKESFKRPGASEFLKEKKESLKIILEKELNFQISIKEEITKFDNKKTTLKSLFPYLEKLKEERSKNKEQSV